LRGIRSPEANVAEHAIHFWSDSQNTVCEQNVIINCDRGIGFGLGDRGHVGGVIRNNMIYHADLGAYDRGDVGIELENSSGTKVYNNTIYQEHDYDAAISVRWPGSTNVHVANNLILKNGGLTYGIWRRDGCTVVVENNYVGPLAAWFVNPMLGDLHLAGDGDEHVVNQGIALPALTDDFDGEARPLGSGIELGADEIAAGPSPVQHRSWGGVKGSYR
jgi:parallel beta-helix repeat protein